MNYSCKTCKYNIDKRTPCWDCDSNFNKWKLSREVELEQQLKAANSRVRELESASSSIIDSETYFSKQKECEEKPCTRIVKGMKMFCRDEHICKDFKDEQEEDK